MQSSSRRMHSHDVRALAIWPPHMPLPASHRRQFPLDVAPVLASGGLDMSVVVTPAALPASTVTHVVNPLATSADATFEDAYHRRLAYTSAPYHASALHLARAARLLLCMRDAGVSLWRIHRRRTMFFDDEDPDSEPPADGGWEQVLDMDFSVHTNLVASAISDDGRWIAVSDWYESKLFRIEELVSLPIDIILFVVLPVIMIGKRHSEAQTNTRFHIDSASSVARLTNRRVMLHIFARQQ